MAKTASKKRPERVSVNTFYKLVPQDEIIDITVESPEGEEIPLQVFYTLPLYDMLDLVKFVVDTCVGVEDGAYVPEAYNFAIRTGVLTHYANVTMPSNLEKRYALAYDSGVFEVVMAYINKTQFDDIVKAIDKKIAFELEVITSSAVSKIDEVIDKMSDFANMSSEAFDSLDPEEVGNVMKGIASMNDDPTGIVETVISKAGSEDLQNALKPKVYNSETVARG